MELPINSPSVCRLYGVAGEDLITLGVEGGLLLLVALGAAYLPERRA